LSQLSAASAVSPNRHWRLSRPRMSDPARDVRAVNSHRGWLASSSYGNFTLTKTAAVPRFPSQLRHLKIAYENRSSYGDGRASRRDRTSHVQPTTMNTRLHARLRGARTWP